jgi:phosphinothricin acetyltransferase
MIRPAHASDAASLAGLYNHYVINSVTTFEEEPVTVQEMAGRVEEVQSLGLPWLVLEQDGALYGYACAVRWKGRSAYRHSVESTIYLAHEQTGSGYGVELYGALLKQLQALQVHSVLGGIALPNDPSVALHEKLAFVKVAHLSEVGRKFGRWIDVGYWQRLLV